MIADIDRLAETFAQHELGYIPVGLYNAIHQLGKAHRLGVVSNLWSGKALFLVELREAGIWNLFEALVLSSDPACIKPSPRMFQKALDCLGGVFVGDDWECDMLATRTVGTTDVWVDRAGSGNRPGHWIRSVTELVLRIPKNFCKPIFASSLFS